jgi:toxin FitB
MNILLDTNVLSETIRALPSPSVRDWLISQPSQQLFVSAITQAEMLFGLRVMPSGKRKQALEQALDKVFNQSLAGRVLPFDSDCALSYADIVSTRRKAGRPMSLFDAQIAAVAHARGMPVATRNVRDFEDCGVAVINPWLSD